MAAKVKTYSVHHLVILIVICWPMVLTYLKYTNRESAEDTDYNKPKLTGIVIHNKKAEFSSDNWFSGVFQMQSDDYNSDHWSLKEIMVRLNNQLYFKLFHQIRVNTFVIGKEDYVFSESYIFSAFGDDLMKQEQVNTLLKKAKVVQDTLKKKGIDLLLVYAPGKGVGCREFVQDKYVHPYKQTNHDLFVAASQLHKVNYLDLYAYFERLKPISPYPLFPKFGHHWSYYGECIAVDTIIKQIENLHHCDMPDISWKEIHVVDTARSRDGDVLNSMNLLINPELNMKLAYPQIIFEDDSVKNRTRVLTISDSYWYGPVYMGVGHNCFAGGQFWYYYNKVIPSPLPDQKVEAWELDLKTEIESNGVIMLLYSDGNLPTFGSNFIQDAYELYTSPKTYYLRNEKHKQIQIYAKQIRQGAGLLKKATIKSKELGIPLDSAIKLDAINMLNIRN